ncbi:unnamed protein product [Auanema sp. JU1783]|nr:unnamed protein product [Auanema sp. JU1783]
MSNALRASHLSSLTTTTAEQPSTFDIISQESLTKSLKPALGHLLKFLSLTKPQKFRTAYRYYEELYLIFDFLLQSHYLRHYGGTFSENFYSMKRTGDTTLQPPSSGMAFAKSLAITSLWPYLSDKLDAIHKRLKDELQLPHLSTSSEAVKKAKKMFVALWPWIKRILSIATTIMQILYMINRSRFNSPLLYLAGVRLEKLTPEDIANFESIPLHLQGTGILSRLYRFILSLPGVFSRIFGYCLFFVQFIDYIYSGDFNSQLTKLSKGNTLIPPAPHEMLNSEFVHSMETSKCPLCHNKRINDTALSVSGYVFCYSCISDYVKKYKRCPITNNPTTVADLIRLYTQ